MSDWNDHKIFEKLELILRIDANSYEPHHMGFPYMSAYQLAISFVQEYPQIFANLGMPLGGEGIGQHTSFSQYIARELSRRIHTGEITTIEGGFFSNTHLKELSFDNEGEIIHSSLTGTKFTLSLFRWIGT